MIGGSDVTAGVDVRRSAVQLTRLLLRSVHRVLQLFIHSHFWEDELTIYSTASPGYNSQKWMTCNKYRCDTFMQRTSPTSRQTDNAFCSSLQSPCFCGSFCVQNNREVFPSWMSLTEMASWCCDFELLCFKRRWNGECPLHMTSWKTESFRKQSPTDLSFLCSGNLSDIGPKNIVIYGNHVSGTHNMTHWVYK